MAFSEQTATDLNDILVRANTFFGADSWTINSFIDDSSKYGGDVFTGKRLHIQKDFTTDAGVVTCYANLRSANNQNVYEYEGTTGNALITGIACNCSRGYSGALSWDYQTLAINTHNALSEAGSANLRKTSTIKCHFFSGENSGAILMEGTDQWYAVVFGVTNLGVPFYACSGGYRAGDSSEVYGKSKTMLSSDGTSNNDSYFSSALYKEELGKWTYASSSVAMSGTRQINHQPAFSNIAKDLFDTTPDTYTGNPILIPSHFVSTDETSTYIPLVDMGHCPDIAIVNMKNLQDEDVISIGADNWVCYFVNNDATYGSLEWGYALKK
jgi:hypothetical protein